MNPESRRRVYLLCAAAGWVSIAVVWLLQQSESATTRWTYPILLAYLVVAWLGLLLRWASVVAIEQATFWTLGVFWLSTMAARLLTAPDPDTAWQALSPTVFMGLAVSVVMGFLWFDTGPALRNVLMLPVGSAVIGGVYFSRHPTTDGHHVLDLVRYEAYLVIIAVFVYALARSKDTLLRTRIESEQMRNLANQDPLTGLANRRRGREVLDELVLAGRPIGLVLLDIDHFKAVNDTLGHQAGDRVLVGVAQVLRAAANDCPLLARWGGEEFLVAVDGDLDRTALQAERIRATMAQWRFDGDLRVTGSLGVALVSGTVEQSLQRADAELYRAKTEGRNLVRVVGR